MKVILFFVSLFVWCWNASVVSCQQQIDKSAVGTGYFNHKSVIIPHDDKIHRGGEDSASTSDIVLVVADGVGGWARHGVNPGLYSKLLTESVVKLVHQNTTRPLVQIVEEANWMAAAQHLGSATCTVVQITSSSTLKTLNIGDSGYSLFRIIDDNDDNNNNNNDSNLKHLFTSTPGQKSFNFPHQIGGQYGDTVSDVAVEQVHDYQPGDVIIVFSDGVSDNLYPSDYEPCIQEYIRPDDGKKISSYSLVADCIARKAYALGKDRTFVSPFAMGAREAGKGLYTGGKHDDITVVVAQVYPGTTSSAGEVKDNDKDDDPHYSEPITLYTGKVPPLSDLPKGKDVPRKLVHEEL